MIYRKALTAALAIVGTAGALTGCAAASSSAPAKPTSTIQVTTAPGTAKGFVGARHDVTMTGCTNAGSATNATGSVKNPTKKTQSYRIYISAIDGSRTIALQEVDVEGVEAGTSQSWSATLPASAADVSCILRVERTARA